MLTVDQITQNIVNQIKTLDPTVSAEVGTPERKLIEAVAEMVASSQVDFSVLSNTQDLSTLSGGRLDAYLSIFSFGRQQATPAYGTVTFSRAQASATSIVIPTGTQLLAQTSDPIFPSLVFVTTQTVVMDENSTSVDATVQCSTAGSVGNISANQITGFSGFKSIVGITSVTNANAMSGGADQESDADYKVRFQNTLFRNISGTNDQYLALAIGAQGVVKANVVGPVSRYQEYIEIPDTDDAAQHTQTGGYDDGGTVWPHKRTSAKSTIPYSKHTYLANYYLTDGTLDPATANFYRDGVDFVFNAPPIDATTPPTQANSTPATSPNITFLATAEHGGNPALVQDTVVLLEHAYISQNSRNDFTYGIFNCVDVFIEGVNPTVVDSVEVVPTSANVLQNTVTTRWTYQHTTATVVINFKRVLDGKNCAVGSLFQPVFWQPMIDLPDLIQVGSSTYYKANYWNSGDSTYYNEYDGVTYSKKAHYIAAIEVNSNYGTLRSRNGIEWFQSGNNYLNGQLATDDDVTYTGVKIESQVGTQFTVEGYSYDSNVGDLQAVMEKNKQTTTDVLVHQAKRRYFKPMITVMYTLGATKAVVDAAIIAILDQFFENQYFGAAVQMSDILQAVHNVPGVDNVRWTNPDTSGNKVEEVNPDGSSFTSPIYFTTDFFLQDNELPTSPDDNQVVITVKAQNTWG